VGHDGSGADSGYGKTRFSHNDAPNRVALYDLGAAASYLTLQAAALGIASHQMASGLIRTRRGRR